MGLSRQKKVKTSAGTYSAAAQIKIKRKLNNFTKLF
jgi:hypothetical protein